MTITYFPFDAGAGSSITEDQWRKMGRLWLRSGPILGDLNGFSVYADSSGMQAKVRSGRAWIEGHFVESDAEEIVAIDAADPTNPRIDRVILKNDFVANTITLAVLKGTPAASPAAPGLTQSTARWEISLAQVRVNAAVATITAGNVTDERELQPIGARSVGAFAYRDTSIQSVGSGVDTYITLNAEGSDSDGFYNTANNYIEIPIGLGGYYLINAQVRWDVSATGVRRAEVVRDRGGSLTVLAADQRGSAFEVRNNISSGRRLLLALDKLRLRVSQDSGANRDINFGADNTFLSAEFLGR